MTYMSSAGTPEIMVAEFVVFDDPTTGQQDIIPVPELREAVQKFEEAKDDIPFLIQGYEYDDSQQADNLQYWSPVIAFGSWITTSIVTGVATRLWENQDPRGPAIATNVASAALLGVVARVKQLRGSGSFRTQKLRADTEELNVLHAFMKSSLDAFDESREAYLNGESIDPANGTFVNVNITFPRYRPSESTAASVSANAGSE